MHAYNGMREQAYTVCTLSMNHCIALQFLTQICFKACNAEYVCYW